MILFGSETRQIKNKYTLRQSYPIFSMVTGAFNGDDEPIETEGIISEVGTDYFVVNYTTIWYDNSATIKFEPGYGNTIDVDDEVQVEAYTNVDNSGTAIKFQIGPL